MGGAVGGRARGLLGVDGGGAQVDAGNGSAVVEEGDFPAAFDDLAILADGEEVRSCGAAFPWGGGFRDGEAVLFEEGFRFPEGSPGGDFRLVAVEHGGRGRADVLMRIAAGGAGEASGEEDPSETGEFHRRGGAERGVGFGRVPGGARGFCPS